MKYLYKGPFSIEDGGKGVNGVSSLNDKTTPPDKKNGTYQQWFNGKIYEESEINVSSKRIKTLVKLGYLTPIQTKKGK